MIRKIIPTVHIALYRLTGGRIGGSVGRGRRVLLLTTTGRQSGKRRTIPLVYGEDDGRMLLVASNWGGPKHPLWYLNLVANPEVRVRAGGQSFRARAREATAEERPRAWEVMMAVNPGYADYIKATEGIREIPLVILERVA